MAKVQRVESLPELAIDQPNMLHIQESYLRQAAHAKPVTACKKRKSEVAGTGAKMFRQKGTGRARQGERRNPHMTGGGLAFPPKPRVPRKRLNKRVRVSALRSAVLWHVQNGSAYVIAGSDFEGLAKTKQVAKLLKGLLGGGMVCLVLDPTSLAWRSGRNIAGLLLIEPKELNVGDLADCACLAFSEAALEQYKKMLELQSELLFGGRDSGEAGSEELEGQEQGGEE